MMCDAVEREPRLERPELFVGSILARGFLEHALEGGREGLLTSKARRNCDVQHGAVGEDEHLCRLGKPAATDVAAHGRFSAEADISHSGQWCCFTCH